MAHYKSMYDGSDFLFAFDLQGKEHTLEIEKVVAGEVTGEKGRKSKKPVVKFRGAQKRLALNKTNGKTIATLYGPDTTKWVGKFVTIYPTVTDFGGETVECIRVKPHVPQLKGKPRDADGAPSADEIAEIQRKEADQ